MPVAYQNLIKKATLISLTASFLLTMVSPALAKVPSDPEYLNQQSMWQQIGAPAAWDFTTGSTDVTVAIIDTGADTWHDDLRDNIWTNPYEIAGNAIDDDHNGYVDDIQGWNFIGNNNDARTSVFEAGDDPEAVRHGTIIAGLIGAAAQNNVGGVGLNWHVKLMPLRAIASSGEGEYDQVIKAVDYAAQNGADIISMSFVGDVNDNTLREHLKSAYEKGVLIVVAGGNHSRDVSGDLDQRPLYPACYDQSDSVNWLLTVGSVNQADGLSGFSDYGKCLDMVAPGEKIFSTERYAPQYGYQKAFGGPWKGTSFSAPLVAGAAALLKSIHAEWGPEKLKETLLNTADPVDLQNLAFQGKLGHGRLNVGKAVAVAASLKAPGKAGGYYYFFSSSTIKRLNFDSRAVETVTDLPGEKIRALSVYNPNSGSKSQLAVLVARRSFYYLRLYKDAGEFINEFSLELPARSDVVVKRFHVSASPSIPGRFVVEIFYPKKKQTIFTVFNERGEIVKTVKFAGAIDNWTLGRYDGALITAQMVGKRLQVKQSPWDGTAAQIVAIAALSGASVEAVRSGHVSLGANASEQTVLITRRGQRVEQALVDFNLGTSIASLVAVTSDKAPWRLLLGDSTTSEEALLFPFSTSGGIFRLMKVNGEPVSEIKLPELKGTTD